MEYTDLISVTNSDDKLLLIYSLKYDINEFYEVYKYYFLNYKDTLKKYIFTEDNADIELFHLIYFDLFKYKKKELSKSKIKSLIQEYEKIKNNIIKGINELSLSIKNSKNISNIEKKIQCKQSFLYSTYNISGIIDYKDGSIEKDSFVYLITPIIDKNVYYKSNTYSKINFTLVDEYFPFKTF